MTSVSPATLPASGPASAGTGRGPGFGKLLLTEWIKIRSVRSTLWTLILLFVVIVFVVGELAAFGSFFAGSAILHSHVHVSLSDPGVTRAILGAGLYLTVLGWFSMAIGGLLRHTAGAITTAIGVVFVLPIIAAFLPASWGQHIHDYLPSSSGSMIAQAHQGVNQVLSPWQGFGVFCIWTALLLAAAFTLLQRRDA